MVSVLTIGTVTSTGTEMGSGTEKIVGARRSIDIIGVATTRNLPGNQSAQYEMPLPLHRQQAVQKECVQVVQAAGAFQKWLSGG